MNPLTAHSGLSFHVSFIFRIHLSNNQFNIFQLYFGNLVNYFNKINDEGVTLQFNLNINEELSKFGRFKDVPTKAEVEKFMPIIIESDTYQNSELLFLTNLIDRFIFKEKFSERKIPLEITILKRKLDQALERPETIVNNLVLDRTEY